MTNGYLAQAGNLRWQPSPERVQVIWGYGRDWRVSITAVGIVTVLYTVSLVGMVTVYQGREKKTLGILCDSCLALTLDNGVSWPLRKYYVGGETLYIVSYEVSVRVEKLNKSGQEGRAATSQEPNSANEAVGDRANVNFWLL